MNDHDTDTVPPSEGETTQTDNARPARNPPPPDDLSSSQLANHEPPEWFKASFIGQALSKFADDARTIREGRERQHLEQMGKLGELSANQELISGELRTFRKASQAKDAEHDKRFEALEKEVRELRAMLKAQEADLEFTKKMIEEVEGKLLADAAARAAAQANPSAEPA